MRVEINLLAGSKKKSGGGGLSMPNLSELARQIKDPLLIGTVAVWVIALGAVGFLYTQIQGQLTEKRAEVEAIRAEAERFSDQVELLRQVMERRDSVVTELDAIREIDDDRYIWPHILHEVSTNLPDYTWLMGLSEIAGESQPGAAGDGIRFNLSGRTSNIAAYTKFLRDLQDSPWVSLAQGGATERTTEDARQVFSFTINVTFQVADSSYIVTVPATQSVGQ